MHERFKIHCTIPTTFQQFKPTFWSTSSAQFVQEIFVDIFTIAWGQQLPWRQNGGSN